MHQSRTNARAGPLAAMQGPGGNTMTFPTTRPQLNSDSAASLWPRLIAAFAVSATLALTACGGGGSEGVAPPPGNGAPPTPPAVAPTRSEAARFLTQSTFGPSSADVDRVVAIGYAAWLNEQFESTASTTCPRCQPLVTRSLRSSLVSSRSCPRSGPRRRSLPTSCASVRCTRCRSCM